MSLDAVAIVSAVTSHVAASGVVDRVYGHEPVNPPGNGLSAAVWANTGGPAAGQSGLASTTARLGLTVRIYASAEQEPKDLIETSMLHAVDVLMAAYSGDFTLGGAVKEVDLLGDSGPPLGFAAGYLPLGDGKLLRVYDITLPVVVNDLWQQSA